MSVLLLGLSALGAVLVSRRLVRPLDAAARTASRLSELSDQVAQLERTLTAVIQAARRPRRSAESGGTDAVATVRERAEFWEPLVQDQGRALTLDLPAVPASVSCDGASLAAAVDALLENVVAHTPEGTSMEVRVTTAEEHEDGAVRRWTRVDVLDDGPGFAPSARVRGHSDRGSTGLGLDIAARCAEDVGGRLEIDRDRSRTRVRLVLPAVPMVGPTRT